MRQIPLFQWFLTALIERRHRTIKRNVCVYPQQKCNQNNLT